MDINIEIKDIPECCAVCDFWKSIKWENKGWDQISKCLATGIVHEMVSGDVVQKGVFRYDTKCPFYKHNK